MIALAIFLQLLDGLLTVIGVGRGLAEVNPVIVMFGIPGLIVLKTTGVIAISVGMQQLRQVLDRDWCDVLLLLWCLGMGYACLANVFNCQLQL